MLTKDNLVSCGIIAPAAHLCIFGCGGVELARHLFLSYSFFGLLWLFVRYLISFSPVDSQILSGHFL
jgi:hypothetical protein